MSIELGKDVLYLPKVVQNQGGSIEGINYGLLCITLKNLYYVPKHVVNMKRTSTLSEEYDVTDQKVKTYEGMKFEEVVPDVAKNAGSMEEFEQFMNDMAGDVKGSCVVPVSGIGEYQIGFFAQFSFSGTQGKYKFSVGGKKQREAVLAFLKDRLGKQ